MTTDAETITVTPSGEAKPAKNAKRRRRRRIAKVLAYLALAFAAIIVLAEPWVLIPIGLAAVAVSLWD